MVAGRGACMVAGGHAWLLGGGVVKGGMRGEGVCVVKGVCMVKGGMHGISYRWKNKLKLGLIPCPRHCLQK